MDWFNFFTFICIGYTLADIIRAVYKLFRKD